MGKMKNRVIDILEIADSLSDDFDINSYADFTVDDVEYIAMEAQVDVKFVCDVLQLKLENLEAYQ